MLEGQTDYKGNPRTPEEQKRLEREAEKKNQEEEKMDLPKKYKMTWTPDLVEKAENDFWGLTN